MYKMGKHKGKYTLDVLNHVVKRDECTLIGQYERVCSNTRIHYVCGEKQCSKQYAKCFKNLITAGAFCRKCCDRKKLEKAKHTSLIRYGTDNPAKSQVIKNKIKSVCLQKFGVEHAGQCDVIKEKAKTTNIRKYGVSNVFQSETIKQRIKFSLMKKYGVSNPQKSEIIKEKSKRTCLAKYNAENPMQNEDVRNKGKQTNLERYGVENTFQSDDIKNKIKLKTLEVHGVEYNAQRPEVQEARIQTCITKYGCRNHMQNAEVFERCMKATFKMKEYTFEDGERVEVQGYEPWALQLLEYAGYCSTDISVNKSQVPSIWYEVNGKTKRYYCDLYIPKERVVVEVKSTYTYQCDIVKLMKVQIECDKQQMKFCLLVFDDKGMLDLEKCIF